MRLSEKFDEILPAIAKVKSKLSAVVKSSNNPFYNSTYADLNTHLEEVEPLLSEHDLVLLQPISTANGENVVESIIFHVKSGQFISSAMRLVGEADMQKAGSAVTYARRYTIGALLGMKAEDDDGNVASGKKASKTQTRVATNKKTRPSFNRKAVTETYQEDCDI